MELSVPNATVKLTNNGVYVLTVNDETIYVLNQHSLLYHLDYMDIPRGVADLIIESLTETGIAAFSA